MSPRVGRPEVILEASVCVTCGRKMRPIGTTTVEFPGTITRTTKDFCARDYEVRRKEIAEQKEAARFRALPKRVYGAHELAVADLVKRECGPDATSVLSMLGLEEAVAS